MLLICLYKHISLGIRKNFSCIDASKCVVWVAIDVGEEVFSPAGMLEGIGE